MSVLAIDIQISEPINNAIDKFLGFIPSLLVFLVVLVVGLFIAKMIRKAVSALLQKINFDSYLDKAGIGGPLESAGFKDSGKLVAQLIYYFIVLIVLQIALTAFATDNPISLLLNDFIAWIPKLFVALVIIVITGLVAGMVRNVLSNILASNSNAPLLTNLAVVGVWLLGIFAALDQAQFAQDIVDTLFQALVASISAIMIIKFGVGGIWAARDRFWPVVYDKVGSANKPT